MRWYEQLFAVAIVLLTPVSLAYAWWYYLAKLRDKRREVRSIVSVLALAIVTSSVVLWPVMIACSPRGDAFGSNYGVIHTYVAAWHKPILRGLLGATILALFSKPRLIAPIAISAVGMAVFWIFSTAL